ncbi:hypothetical protein KB219_34825, partial [Pseudomonas aeruginosa]|nr:hypothetical protein [Pseudomonas aeruginosa]
MPGAGSSAAGGARRLAIRLWGQLIWDFLSNLFGGNKEDKALREALAHIHRILDDEKFQLELVHPMMKA